MVEIKRYTWDEEAGRLVVETIQPSNYFRNPCVDDVMRKIIRNVERDSQLKKNDDWYKSLKENLR